MIGDTQGLQLGLYIFVVDLLPLGAVGMWFVGVKVPAVATYEGYQEVSLHFLPSSF